MNIPILLLQHKRKVLLTLVTSLVVGALFAARPQVWRAETAVLVDPPRPAAAEALSAILRSQDLHRQVLDRVGPRLFPSLAQDMRPLMFPQHLEVTASPDGSLLKVGLTGNDGAAVAEALAALLEGARSRNRVIFAATGGSDRLAAAREALASFRQRHGLHDLRIEKEALVRRQGEAEAAVLSSETEAAALSGTLGSLKTRLAATPATISLANESERSKVAEDARSKLFELQAKEAELLGKYQPDSLFVRNVREEKRKIETLLSKLDVVTPSRSTSGANPLHQDLEKALFQTEAALSSVQARVRASRDQAKALAQRLDLLAGHEKTLRELEEAVSHAEGEVSPSSVSTGLASFGVVDGLSAGSRPVGFSRLEIMGLSVGFGSLLSVLVAVLAGALSRRFSTPAEVERSLGLPVLATFPRES